MIEPRLTICGVMSGSSLDGLDMAICTISSIGRDSYEWKIDKAHTAQFPDQLVKDLLASYESTSSFIFDVEQRFTQFCSDELQEFIKTDKVDYISFHGHTIFHEPQKGYTTQIGNNHHLAQNLNIPVIGQFRNKDVALGGQGAPLAPIVEKYLFKDYNSFLNLGGIANISVHNEDAIIAYDITACNQALNHLSIFFNKEYDHNGEIADKGELDQLLLDKLNALEFLKQNPPKSLSNTWVQKDFIPILDEHNCPIENKMTTVVHHIALQIAECCRDMEHAGNILASGGGVHNGYLMSQIADRLNTFGITIEKPTDKLSEYKEALLMALMAYLRVNEVPNCLASVTGASRESCSGIIYHPEL